MNVPEHRAGLLWQVANGNPSTPADFPLHVPSVGRKNNPQHSHIYFVLPRFLIKENALLDPEPRDFSPGGALYCTEHCYIHHTCLQGFALLGDIFQRRRFSGSYCGECHFQDELWGFVAAQQQRGAPFYTISPPPLHSPHAVIALTHNGRSL